MKNLLITALAFFMMVGCATPISGTMHSTARLDIFVGTTPVGVCTAFAISHNELLTAGHCVAEMIKGNHVEFNGARPILIKVDYTNDVAKLFLPNHGVKPLKVANHVKMGDEAYVVGCPMGSCGIITRGWVAESYKHWMVISASSTGGNSGSPVLNSDGEVIGILVAGPTYGHISVCTPLRAIKSIVN